MDPYAKQFIPGNSQHLLGTKFQNLPPELLEKISKYLYAKELTNLSQTSKNMNTILTKQKQKRRINLVTETTLLALEFVRTLHEFYDNVSIITDGRCVQYYKNHFKSGFNTKKNLKAT